MLTDEIVKATIAQPLHRRRDSGLQDAFVSEHSRWKESRWCFDNRTPGAHAGSSTIYWDYELPDGLTLMDDAHFALADWSRRFAWSLVAEPGDGASPLAPGSIGNFATGHKTFVMWMVRNNYKLPHQLDEVALLAYLRDLPEILAEDEQDDEAEVGIGIAQAYNRVRIPILLWQQRKALASAGIASTPRPPWEGRSALDVAQDIATKAAGFIKPLPDEVAIPILNKAAWFLGTPTEDVIRLHQSCMDAYYRPPGSHPNGPGTSPDAAKVRRRRAQHTFAFTVLPSEHCSWLEDRRQLDSSALNGAIDAQLVRQLVLAVRSAAVITIQAGSGMRISEICGLPAGIDAASGLPACVRIETSSTGLNELFIVRTVLSKTEETPRDVDWVVGMRPLGSNELPLPVQALIVLNRLFEPYRSMIGTPRLLVTFSNNRGLPRASKSVRPILADDLREYMKRFIEEWVDLSNLPDESAHKVEDSDLVPYRESKGRCVQTHQLRKSFGNFAFAVDTRLLPVLQMQFHHISQAMTEHAYVGRNPAQIEAFSSVQRQQANMLVFEMATGRTLTAGLMGEQIEQSIGDLRKKLKGMSTHNSWKEVVRFVNDYDLRLWFAPHGKCLPLIPESMRCHLLAGTTHWLNREPNYSTRSPSICVGCQCFVFDARHGPFWEARYIDNWLAYKRAEALGSAGQFRVMRERAGQARILLSRIGVRVEHLDARIAKELANAA